MRRKKQIFDDFANDCDIFDDFVFDITVKRSPRKRSGDGSDFFVAEPQKTKYKNMSISSVADIVKKYR